MMLRPQSKCRGSCGSSFVVGRNVAVVAFLVSLNPANVLDDLDVFLVSTGLYHFARVVDTLLGDDAVEYQ